MNNKRDVPSDQKNTGTESLDSGEEIVETSESESPSEEETESSSEEEERESPVTRKSARARKQKKVFSYDLKGQPFWEDSKTS